MDSSQREIDYSNSVVVVIVFVFVAETPASPSRSWRFQRKQHTKHNARIAATMATRNAIWKDAAYWGMISDSWRGSGMVSRAFGSFKSVVICDGGRCRTPRRRLSSVKRKITEVIWLEKVLGLRCVSVSLRLRGIVSVYQGRDVDSPSENVEHLYDSLRVGDVSTFQNGLRTRDDT